MEIPDEKVLELFYAVGEVSTKVDIVFNQLIGEDGKGEIAVFRTEINQLKAQMEQVLNHMRLNQRKRMSRKTKAALYTGIAVGGKLLFEAGKVLSEYIQKGGVK